MYDGDRNPRKRCFRTMRRYLFRFVFSSRTTASAIWTAGSTSQGMVPSLHGVPALNAAEASYGRPLSFLERREDRQFHAGVDPPSLSSSADQGFVGTDPTPPGRNLMLEQEI